MKEKIIFISIIFGYAAFFMAFIAIDHFLVQHFLLQSMGSWTWKTGIFRRMEMYS